MTVHEEGRGLFTMEKRFFFFKTLVDCPQKGSLFAATYLFVRLKNVYTPVDDSGIVPIILVSTVPATSSGWHDPNQM